MSRSGRSVSLRDTVKQKDREKTERLDTGGGSDKEL